MDFVFNPITGQLDAVSTATSSGGTTSLPAGAFDYGSITVAVDIVVDYGDLT